MLIPCAPNDQTFFSVPAGVWLTPSTVWKMRFRSSNRWVLPSTSTGTIVEAKWDISNKMRGLEYLVLAIHAAPPPTPPHSSRTTSAWGGRWKRSSEREKSWSGSSGGFWRTWTTPAGMRPTSEYLSQGRRQDCFLMFRGQRSNEMLSSHCGPNGPSAKTHCYPLKPN